MVDLQGVDWCTTRGGGRGANIGMRTSIRSADHAMITDKIRLITPTGVLQSQRAFILLLTPHLLFGSTMQASAFPNPEGDVVLIRRRRHDIDPSMHSSSVYARPLGSPLTCTDPRWSSVPREGLEAGGGSELTNRRGYWPPVSSVFSVQLSLV